MTMENLKSKLHAIFENCGTKLEETPIEIKGMVQEDAVPPTPAPVVPPAAAPAPTTTQAPATQNKQEFKLQSGVVVYISLDAAGNVVVTDQHGADAKGSASPEELNAMKVQLGGGQQAPTQQPVQQSQPTVASEPAEAPIAETKV